MVIHTESVYGSGSGCTCSNNIATEITHVDDTPANNRTTHFTYDWRNRRIATSGELNAYSTVTYDNQDRVLTTSQFDGETGPLLRHATTTYDDRSRVYFSSQAEVVSGSLTGNSIDQQQTHDQSGNVLVQTPAGNATNATIEYDDLGRSIKQTNPLGDFSTTTYNNIGQQTAVTNLNGHTSTMTYDPLGRLIASTTPLGHTTQRHYNAKGELHQTTDANGNTTTQTFDAASRLLKSTNPEGHETTITYDAAGNQLTVTNALGLTTSFTYDHLNRLTSTTDPLTNTTQTLYNRIGEVSEEIDAKLQSTTHTYNALGQKVSTTNRLGDLTTYTYNSLGQQLSMTDPETQTTSYLYDSYGRRIQTTWPDHIPGQLPGDPNYGITTTTYDNLNRILRTTDQLGDTITHTYNNAGHLTQRDYRTRANSPTGTISDSDTFTYNAAGNLLTATKGRDNNVVTYTYDNDDRKSTESLTIDGQTYTTSAGYNAVNQITQLTYPDGTVIDRSYNTRNLLIAVSRSAQTLVTRSYDGLGQMTTQSFGNGVSETWSYDANSGVTQVINPGGTFAYTYDENDNRTAETITGAMSNASWSTPAVGFDEENRLTARNQTYDNLQESWQLSEVGNWDQFNQNTTAISRNLQFNHGPAHEITDIGALTPYTHDARGNLINDNWSTYTWDADNLMTASSRGTSYVYDATGRRVKRTDSSGSTVFACWGHDVIADYTSGNAPASPTRQYVYGDQIDNVLVMLRASDEIYYHADAQTSIRCLTNDTGSLVESYLYTAYGVPTIFNGTGTKISATAYDNRFLYTAREWDHKTYQYYLRARWYSPGLGRFTSRDPLHYVDGPSLYRGYFSPGSVDPWGLVNLKDMHNKCVRDCEDLCIEQYSWWNPSRYSCVGACGASCAGYDLSTIEGAIGGLCHYVNNWPECYKDGLNCICGVGGSILDFIPLPPGWSAAAGGVDCGCEFVSLLQSTCHGAGPGGLFSQLLPSVFDCLIDIISLNPEMSNVEKLGLSVIELQADIVGAITAFLNADTPLPHDSCNNFYCNCK